MVRLFEFGGLNEGMELGERRETHAPHVHSSKVREDQHTPIGNAAMCASP